MYAFNFQQDVWLFHHSKSHPCMHLTVSARHLVISSQQESSMYALNCFSKTFGYFITAKVIHVCVELFQQDVWLFHHSKTGTCFFEKRGLEEDGRTEIAPDLEENFTKLTLF